MTFLRKTLALSAAFAVAVSLFGAVTTTANASGVPFTAYGTGATAGDEIGIKSGSTLCESVTADASGQWGPVSVGASLGDCSFADGDTISFCLNGSDANESETWSVGGAPSDVVNGTVLTAAAAAASEGQTVTTTNCGGGTTTTDDGGGTTTTDDGGGTTTTDGGGGTTTTGGGGTTTTGGGGTTTTGGGGTTTTDDDVTVPAVPVPGPTGNAGLFSSDAGTSTIAALLLAVMATVVVAGGRAATRTR